MYKLFKSIFEEVFDGSHVELGVFDFGLDVFRDFLNDFQMFFELLLSLFVPHFQVFVHFLPQFFNPQGLFHLYNKYCQPIKYNTYGKSITLQSKLLFMGQKLR